MKPLEHMHGLCFWDHAIKFRIKLLTLGQNPDRPHPKNL